MAKATQYRKMMLTDNGGRRFEIAIELDPAKLDEAFARVATKARGRASKTATVMDGAFTIRVISDERTS